ncbi:hypothetical protein F4805DRAFT_451283 [Annulohypoxylon moriforme]|nr:hypothetical protein F4805DRAFT_451283 [Annulohypoxylon moriforme]
MALLYNLEPYLTDLSDTSTDETEPHETMASSAVPSSESMILDRDKYSDKDIQILYQIVTRAEEILNDYTPTSRLPTHALYNAYDEVLPQHGINPDDDRLISELVFKVGGVRNTDSLREKFETVVSRLGITVEWDDPPAHGNEFDDGQFVVDKVIHKEDPPFVNGKHGGDDYGHVIPENRHDYHMNGVNGNASAEEDPANVSKIEQQLECSAIAFQKKHHDKFSAMAAIRQWQKRSNYAGTLCEQFDAARQADLEEDLEARFEEWRALSAEVDRLPPHCLPPNVYSKRLEGIAIRAREIHNAKLTLRRWRHNTREQSRKTRKIEESSDPIERVAAKAHKNLMLSRAFTNWSNRLEEESDRAQMAAKVYEMRLKSKAFGIHRRPNEDVQMGGTRNSPVDTSPPAYIANAEDDPKPVLPSTKVATNVIDFAGPPDAIPDVREKSSPEAPAKNTSSNNNPDNSDDDNDDNKMDEITLLARRHILRMRYYDIWEKYTADKLMKARKFQAEQQIERIAQTIPVWRSQAEQASQQHETLRYNAKRAGDCNKAVKAIDVWRQESEEKMQGQDQLLDHYAKLANFYYKATKSVPIWRSEAERSVKQQEVLELYADQAEYNSGVTKSLPIWRAQTQQVVEHEKQTLAYYAQRADFYYKTRDTLLSWQDLAKKKRKQRLKDAHLETRRLVKKGMGERCIAQWREKLQPSFERYEAMNAIVEDIVADREYRQSMESFDIWRERARERNEMGATSDVMAKEKLFQQWREQSRRHEGLYIEAGQHWEETAKSKVLKKWNLTTIQIPNRPLMVANALEKKERRLLRTRFESWYGRTADKLVPIELPNGNYRSIDQVVEDAQRQASLSQARGLFDKWQAAAKTRSETVQEEPYIPTPGRPRLFLGSLGTTTPLAPPPNRLNWRASEMAPRGSAIRGRTNRSGRPDRNLRVSWA